MEAKFVSCFEVTSQGVWLKSFIYGLRVMNSISRPLRIFCDNSLQCSWIRIIRVGVEAST